MYYSYFFEPGPSIYFMPYQVSIQPVRSRHEFLHPLGDHWFFTSVIAFPNFVAASVIISPVLVLLRSQGMYLVSCIAHSYSQGNSGG